MIKSDYDRAKRLAKKAKAEQEAVAQHTPPASTPARAGQHTQEDEEGGGPEGEKFRAASRDNLREASRESFHRRTHRPSPPAWHDTVTSNPKAGPRPPLPSVLPAVPAVVVVAATNMNF